MSSMRIERQLGVSVTRTARRRRRPRRRRNSSKTSPAVVVFCRSCRRAQFPAMTMVRTCQDRGRIARFYLPTSRSPCSFSSPPFIGPFVPLMSPFLLSSPHLLLPTLFAAIPPHLFSPLYLSGFPLVIHTSTSPSLVPVSVTPLSPIPPHSCFVCCLSSLFPLFCSHHLFYPVHLLPAPHTLPPRPHFSPPTIAIFHFVSLPLLSTTFVFPPVPHPSTLLYLLPHSSAGTLFFLCPSLPLVSCLYYSCLSYLLPNFPPHATRPSHFPPLLPSINSFKLPARTDPGGCTFRRQERQGRAARGCLKV